MRDGVEAAQDLYERLEASSRFLPVAWPMSRILAQSDEAAVALLSALVFAEVVRFEMRTMTRRADAIESALFATMDEPAPDMLRFGVRLADGRIAVNTDWPEILGTAFHAVDQPLVLQPGHGSGDGLPYDQQVLLSAIPPDGPLEFFVIWPAAGIAETRTVFDATGMTDAAARARRIWPEEEDGSQLSEPPLRRLRFGPAVEGAFFRPILGVDDVP